MVVIKVKRADSDPQEPVAQNNGRKSVASGVVAGLVGGLVASWVMNEFMEKAGPALQRAVESEAKPQEANLLENDANSETNEPEAEDATMKTADAIVSMFTGGQHLSIEQKKMAGPIVHYAFGALMGGLYGGLAERMPAATAGQGTAFGSTLFVGADLVAVPSLHLSSSSSSSASALLVPFAAHLVYGLTTEAVRQLVRSVL